MPAERPPVISAFTLPPATGRQRGGCFLSHLGDEH
jgi:hypothetical protein